MPTKSRSHAISKGRDPKIEADLDDRFNATWTFVKGVSISAFDLEKSLHNQARFEPIDEKVVATYTEAVARGDNFPAVLAWRPASHGRYVIIDGNHRLSAHIRADMPLDVYEIDPTTDPRTVAMMTFSFNPRHGMSTTEAERVSQAVYLVDNGASAEAAAGAVNLRVAVVKKAILRATADIRADEMGVRRNEWGTIHPTIQGRLNNISTDEGFSDAAKLAYAAKLTIVEVGELVALLNGSRSGIKQRAIVAAQREVFSDRIQARAGGVLGTADRRRMTPKQRVVMVLGQVLALPDDDRAIVAGYAEPEREAAGKRMLEASERFSRLAGLLMSTERFDE